MTADTAPEFVEPPTIMTMTEAQQDDLLRGIRERRLIPITLHTQVVTLKNKLKHEKLVTKAEKLANRILKHIERIDKETEQVTGLFAQIKTLRLQAIEYEEEIE